MLLGIFVLPKNNISIYICIFTDNNSIDMAGNFFTISGFSKINTFRITSMSTGRESGFRRRQNPKTVAYFLLSLE